MKARIPKRSLEGPTIDSVRKDIADSKTVAKTKTHPAKASAFPPKIAAESNPVKPIPTVRQIHVLPVGPDSDTMMTIKLKSTDGQEIPDSVLQQLQDAIHEAVDQSAREFAENRAARTERFIQDTINLYYEERELERQLSEHLDKEEATLIEAGENTIRGLEKILANSKQRLSEIYRQINELSLEKSELQKRIDRSDDKLSRLDYSITSTVHEISETEDKLDKRPRGSELRKLESKLEALLAECDKLKGDKTRTITRLEKRKIELAQVSEMLANLEVEKKSLEEVVESATKEIQTIRGELAEFTIPQVFVKRVSCGVIAVFRHFDESVFDDMSDEIKAGRVWSDRITRYLDDRDREVSDTERVLAVKILVRVGKLKPSQYAIHWGDCTETVQELVQAFCRK